MKRTKKNKLIVDLNEASKRRYKYRLCIGEIKTRRHMTPGMLQELRRFKTMKKDNDIVFNTTYDTLLRGKVTPQEIEDRMWYNQWG